MATETELRIEKAAAHEVEERLGANAIFDAKNASDEEHSQTFWQAVKANRKAVGWSMLISMSIVMEGYDTILMVRRPVHQFKYLANLPRATSWVILNSRRNTAKTLVVTLAIRSQLLGRQA